MVLTPEELAFRDCQAASWLLASWQLKEGDLRLRLQILRIVSGGLSTLGLWRSGGRRLVYLKGVLSRWCWHVLVLPVVALRGSRCSGVVSSSFLAIKLSVFVLRVEPLSPVPSPIRKSFMFLRFSEAALGKAVKARVVQSVCWFQVLESTPPAFLLIVLCFIGLQFLPSLTTMKAEMVKPRKLRRRSRTVWLMTEEASGGRTKLLLAGGGKPVASFSFRYVSAPPPSLSFKSVSDLRSCL
ncbi:hypothetical protein Bca52824_036050 [Brassica carinata]|uniref:Uncharacterized protein n=1 Tax=Brassica carinata TaxID=52824 RepID=A0A8X7S4I0_BRACI|nr:hypothetical protein Bca52824_036050 [Brassica carinata]